MPKEISKLNKKPKRLPKKMLIEEPECLLKEVNEGLKSLRKLEEPQETLKGNERRLHCI